MKKLILGGLLLFSVSILANTAPDTSVSIVEKDCVIVVKQTNLSGEVVAALILTVESSSEADCKQKSDNVLKAVEKGDLKLTPL
ncbi:hypothetical protein [Flavobacterium kingsejongi]|uniref:Uncharacterized protein n=1 Tax=Flavobacterium kingsejongi TaxID=1678728 RepID=A0A2S1LLA6_9FLAO|nr:hypothetical protein [Flavobacterium kingsejongi]AWG24316.1 hypothetical protein FK004_03280 [Flavobacterium kingsejongi]